MLVIRYPCIKS